MGVPAVRRAAAVLARRQFEALVAGTRPTEPVDERPATALPGREWLLEGGLPLKASRDEFVVRGWSWSGRGRCGRHTRRRAASNAGEGAAS